MKYPNPKELFHANVEAVQWWQRVVDDPRFHQIRLLAELHAVRSLPNGYNTNVMLANDAVRQGILIGLNAITKFADRSAVEKPLELPPVLHSPDRPVTK